MAVVYRARRAGLARDVALKVILPESAKSIEGLARFRREAELASALSEHPGIVGVHDVGDAGGSLYLAMELVEGESLHEVVHRQQLEAKRIAEIMEAAARAVHFAHTKGVLHRDVKPANILMTADGSIRLTDFGIARTQEVNPDVTQLTRAGQLVGSPDYMSPEQAQGQPIDVRADVYSLGATLYECCTGVTPFAADSLQSLVKQILEDDVVPAQRRNPALPRDLDTIALKCLEKDPERRYPSAEALAEDLARFARAESITARRAGLLERSARRVSRNPAPYAVGAVAAAALLVAAAVMLYRSAQRTAALANTVETAATLLNDAPEQAVGLLKSVQQQAPGYPGIAAALQRAQARAAERALELRNAEAMRFIEQGDAAGARFEEAEELVEREAAWQQAWGFYTAARGIVASHPALAALEAADERLAGLAWDRLREAESAGDDAAAARFQALLAAHGAERYAKELRGDGTFSLDTAPSGATVECFAYEDADGDGRLDEVPRPALGTTPLTDVPLPMGSYLFVLKRDGYRDVRFPVRLERLEQERHPVPVRLFTQAQAGEEWCHVPPGEVVLGGDAAVPRAGPLRVERVHGFLARRREVTAAEYHAFLTWLLEQGGTREEVMARCPRSNTASGHIWSVDAQRRLSPLGHVLQPEWPLFGVSWHDATQFCIWYSKRHGRAVRLPTQTEWVRMARGADARLLPWGNRLDWRWTVGAQSPMHDGQLNPLPVLAAAGDVSPFGVRDLAGSVAEWCADELVGGLRAIHGGAWGEKKPEPFHIVHEHGQVPTIASLGVGIRLVADLP
jgi:serine/threonine-protein kinase